MLFAFRELLNARKDEIAALITAEHGKVLDDALGEVTRGLEVVEFACGIPHLLKGGFSENVSTRVDVYSIRQPLGVVRGHLAVQLPGDGADVVRPDRDRLRQHGGAQAVREGPVGGERDGRAVDARPACRTASSTSCTATRRRSTPLLDHPDVEAVSFVGSTPIARYVYETGTAHGKRVQALGGAKNHMVVLPDADLDLAADAAVNAGFGSAGERCMAISALVAVEPIADELVGKIKERMAQAAAPATAPAAATWARWSPAQHRDKVAGYVEAGRRRGRRAGRRRPRRSTVDGDADGFWLGPDAVRQGHAGDVDLHRRDLRAGAVGRARRRRTTRRLDLVNANPYGNGTAIFTNDGGAARRFQNEVEVGMVGINVPIPVPMAYYSFGGWKNSLFGDTHAHGTEGVHFFTRGKVVTSRWLDPSHGGINLGFPTHD